jgi:hypothetical protein
MKIIECHGVPHTYTQKDGSTFRLYSREIADIDEDQISEEMRAEEQMGQIRILPDESVIKKTIRK